jgi:hypothetical protein
MMNLSAKNGENGKNLLAGLGRSHYIRFSIHIQPSSSGRFPLSFPGTCLFFFAPGGAGHWHS